MTEPTHTPNTWIPSPQVRRYIYGVAIAVLLILATYGIVNADHIPLWTSLLTAVLALQPGLALANTPTKR